MLTDAKHPYTIGLLNSMPKLEGDADGDLMPIDGAPPSLIDLPPTCAFLPRCPFAQQVCRSEPFPAMRAVGLSEHYAACHLQSTPDVDPAATSNMAVQ
jgi:oligopeptide/dipeptide ABC transporter ATP-binding protein